MSVFLSVFWKMFFVFAYLLVVAYAENIVAWLLPDGWLKNQLLRKY